MPARILAIEKMEFLRETLVQVFTQAGFETADASDYY
jgi:hypothetical protein